MFFNVNHHTPSSSFNPVSPENIVARHNQSSTWSVHGAMSLRGRESQGWSLQGDLTCVYMDSPSASSRGRRSPSPANDPASPPTACQQGVENGNLGSLFTAVDDEDECSSTNRLQRLLAESHQMVASSECTTLKPLSPFHSLASNAVTLSLASASATIVETITMETSVGTVTAKVKAIPITTSTRAPPTPNFFDWLLLYVLFLQNPGHGNGQ
ncbi:uncharacterized protein LOC118937877 [Oncorhynchus mykiss]|uniref:uncharacterized protein LOC118937877 n=1 Tax=Oncorhynchus mykiss TaxID=8022 RepID=UPI00187810D2|nr:uncharacterized protein LOC118937877 [Oncorhynchus mykiss]